MDSFIIYLIFIIPLVLVLLYYLSKHNKSKLTDAGMTTFGGFWRSFFKVTGVITAIIGYVIFSHERDEKIKEMVKLAIMYTDGMGVSKNEILAYMLYNLASVNNERYVPIRNFMASQLAPDQLAEAQKLAVNWKVGTPLPTTTKINRRLKYELQ